MSARVIALARTRSFTTSVPDCRQLADQLQRLILEAPDAEAIAFERRLALLTPSQRAMIGARAITSRSGVTKRRPGRHVDVGQQSRRGAKKTSP
jgi:hypothetical protein